MSPTFTSSSTRAQTESNTSADDWHSRMALQSRSRVVSTSSKVIDTYSSPRTPSRRDHPATARLAEPPAIRASARPA